MTMTTGNRPLVGQRCRLVATPEVEGRVIDVAPLGRLLHVELDSERGNPMWVTFDEVERIEPEPLREGIVESGPYAGARVTVYREEDRAAIADPDGYDAHLDDIERRTQGGA